VVVVDAACSARGQPTRSGRPARAAPSDLLLEKNEEDETNMRTGTAVLGILSLTALPLLWARSAAANDQQVLKEAQRTFHHYCAKCHGDDGKGDGPAAATLDPKPRDFANCQDMAKRSDAELFKVISQGGAAANLSPAMVAWGAVFTDDQMHGLVKFVRSFCQKAAAANTH
jgi:mono/diheme cytochrome c family protein